MHSIIEAGKIINNSCDSKPMGHNCGMLLNTRVTDYIISNIKRHNKKTIIIHPSPSGYLLNTHIVKQLDKFNHFVFICSRYEGIDARIINKFNVFEISIGDYILFDGDTSAIVIYNSIVRDKVVKKKAKRNESFNCCLLEYDQFTHPVMYDKYLIPKVIRSGHHKDIEKWQKINSVQKTITKREDLYTEYIKQNFNNE